MPAAIWVLVVTGVIGIPAVTAVALYRSIAARSGRRGLAGAVAGGFAAVWGAWVIASAGLADHDVYRQSATAGRPWIAVAAGGALAGALAAGLLPAAGRALAGPRTLAWLTLPHAVRIVGVAFILAMIAGKVPAVFALPAGLGDIAVGIAAPFIARRLAAGDRRGAVWFNISGIADLVIAVSLGFLAGLGPDRLGVSPSTADVALLPLALIPSTAVPLAVALHVISLARLRAVPLRAAEAASLTA